MPTEINDTRRFEIEEAGTIRQALEQLDRTGQGLLLLVDRDRRLLRTISDGDIRRMLLSGSDLDTALASMGDQKPKLMAVGHTASDALRTMNEESIDHLPVVDENRRVVSIVTRKDVTPILLSTPHLGEFEQEYVAEAFRTNWIAPLGPNVDAFEREIAEYVGVSHAAAMSSGTAALHVALRLLDVAPGDIVFCSSFTFIASASPIIYQGAQPVFIDSERESWNMSPRALSRAMKEHAAKGKLPKAVIVVHLYGQTADLQAIQAICDEYEVPLVEDAAESLGGTYQGRMSGSFGRLSVFSFNGNKIITTSGGGMLVSDDEALIRRARFLSTQAREPAPHYEHTMIGYNYRMSNVLAGIGRGQLRVLDTRIAERRALFERYRRELAEFDVLEWMPEPEGTRSNRWLTAATIRRDVGISSVEVLGQLAKQNIEGRPLWKPMHLQPIFKDASFYPHEPDDRVSDDLFTRGVCLPSGSNMGIDNQRRVIDALARVFSVARAG